MSAQTLTDEVLDLLAGGEALTTREIYQQTTMASEMDQVSKALYFLRKRGDVALAPGLDEAGQRRYRLAAGFVAEGQEPAAEARPESGALDKIQPAPLEPVPPAHGPGQARKPRAARRPAPAAVPLGQEARTSAPETLDGRAVALHERRLALAERAMAVVEMILREERHGLA